MSGETSIEFTVSGEWTLDVDEVWPDGDAPEHPTAADVAAQMRLTGSVHSVIDEWMLVPDQIEIMVCTPGGMSSEVYR